MEMKGCLERGCYHLMMVTITGNARNGKHKIKTKKYTRTTKSDIKLRDLQKAVNNGGKVDYDFWNAVLSS